MDEVVVLVITAGKRVVELVLELVVVDITIGSVVLIVRTVVLVDNVVDVEVVVLTPIQLTKSLSQSQLLMLQALSKHVI